MGACCPCGEESAGVELRGGSGYAPLVANDLSAAGESPLKPATARKDVPAKQQQQQQQHSKVSSNLRAHYSEP